MQKYKKSLYFFKIKKKKKKNKKKKIGFTNCKYIVINLYINLFDYFDYFFL